MAEQLTQRQQAVLQHVKDCVARDGFPPTRAEIARHFGFLSDNAAADYLITLARKGFVRLSPGKSRGIAVIDQVAVVEGQ